MPQKDIGRRYLLLSVWMLRFSSVKTDPVRFAAAVIGLVFFAKEVGGRWYCRGCGMGDGIKLVQQFTKKEFVQTLVHLETLLGLPVPKGKQGRYERSAVARHKLWAEKQRAEQSALWGKAFPLGEIDRQTPVWRYLCARGLGDLVPSRELRFVKRLACWEVPDGQNIDGAAKARLVGEFPAMLARLTNAEGKFITLHRTYLTADGSKAPVHSAKKTCCRCRRKWSDSALSGWRRCLPCRRY